MSLVRRRPLKPRKNLLNFLPPGSKELLVNRLAPFPDLEAIVNLLSFEESNRALNLLPIPSAEVQENYLKFFLSLFPDEKEEDVRPKFRTFSYDGDGHVCDVSIKTIKAFKIFEEQFASTIKKDVATAKSDAASTNSKENASKLVDELFSNALAFYFIYEIKKANFKVHKKITEEKAKKDFYSLLTYRPRLTDPRTFGSSLVGRNASDIYLSDHRAKVEIEDKRMSRIGSWEDNARLLIYVRSLVMQGLKKYKDNPSKSLIAKYSTLDVTQIRKKIADNIQVTQFSPTVVMDSLLNIVAPEFLPLIKKRADFCAGWGDRFVGMIAATRNTVPEEAEGKEEKSDKTPRIFTSLFINDVNNELKEPYEKIAAYKTPEQRVELSFKQAETLTVRDLTSDGKTIDYGIVGFPFFITEKYVGKGQSFRLYPEVSDWFNKFIYKSIINFAAAATTNGYLICNLGDSKSPAKVKIDLLGPFEHFLKNCKLYTYVGKYNYIHTKLNNKLFVVRRNDTAFNPIFPSIQMSLSITKPKKIKKANAEEKREVEPQKRKRATKAGAGTNEKALSAATTHAASSKAKKRAKGDGSLPATLLALATTSPPSMSSSSSTGFTLFSPSNTPAFIGQSYGGGNSELPEQGLPSGAAPAVQSEAPAVFRSTSGSCLSSLFASSSSSSAGNLTSSQAATDSASNSTVSNRGISCTITT